MAAWATTRSLAAQATTSSAAAGGNDVIRGGKGDDVLKGRAGNDMIYGERGADMDLRRPGHRQRQGRRRRPRPLDREPPLTHNRQPRAGTESTREGRGRPALSLSGAAARGGGSVWKVDWRLGLVALLAVYGLAVGLSEAFSPPAGFLRCRGGRWQRGFSLGLSQAAVLAVAAALATVVFALLLPSSVFAAPEKPPTAEGTIPNQEIVPGGSITLDVEQYFSDPDGTDDTLTYAAASSPTGVATVAVTGSVLTITGESATAGTPAGKATITVTATDLGDNTAAQEFEVTVTANTGPQRVGSIPAQAVIAGRTRTVDVSQYFSDPDLAGRGDTLTYTAVSDAPATAETPTPATDPVPDGVLKITGASAGVAVITVTARDIASEAATQTFVVTVTANTPPTAVGSIPAQAVIAGFTRTVDVSQYFSDPDVAGRGDTLTYSATPSNNTVATAAVEDSVVTITGLAAGAGRRSL